MALPESEAVLKERWERDGYIVVRGVVPVEWLQGLRMRAGEIVAEADEEELVGQVFSTGENQLAQKRHRYFLDSAEQVKCFLEEKAVQDGRLVLPKADAVNKIAHNLTELEPLFARVTGCAALCALARVAGVSKPVVVQSMYIMKPPRIGGEVRPHQDATFLACTPDTLTAFWLPVDSARVENACLWAVPGSHRGPLRTRMRRLGDSALEFTPISQPWPAEEAYVPLEMAAGDVLLMHGRLVHRSGANTSPLPRHAYTFHVIDVSSDWAADNWLQRHTPFPPMASGSV